MLLPVPGNRIKDCAGPGVPSSTWTVSYSAANGGTVPCTGCTGTKTVTVQDPRGSVTRHTYGTRFIVDEGQLLTLEEGVGSTAARTTTYRYRAPTAGPYPDPIGLSPQSNPRGDGYIATRHNPQDRRSISLQGTTFTWEATAYDSFGRPTTVTRTGPGGTRTETTAYVNNLPLWVLGQVGTVTSGGQVMQSNDYYAANAMLQTRREFGVVKASYTYNADGTLASRADGANNTISLGSYKRGVPQSVTYPLGISASAVVDDLGRITSYTTPGTASEPGFTTSYGYDTMGRLSSLTPPAGYLATFASFVPVAADEYGLQAGHWRHTATKGTAVTTTYFDALWRPVMTRTYDSNQEATTRKVTVAQFDIDGRPTYESYVARDITTISTTPAGTRTQYDALGRVTQVQSDSELGTLTATTEYLTGFQTRLTNPRAKITTQTFWALDDPSAAALATITAPAGVNVAITRDSFGKPTAITRSGTNAGYTSSVTRRYVYEPGQRLCKTIEPEVGSTVQAYDAAGNVSWKAPGQNLPDPAAGACNESSVLAAARISYGYDALNRLTSVGYGDASPGVTRTYKPDGLLATLTTAGGTWSYDYNALRKIATESFDYGGQTYNFSWGYNTAGDLASLTYPDRTVTYSPNALGEAQAVSGFASAVTYHPNGAVAGATLGNGIAYSLTQNTRGLPLVNRHAGIVQDLYAYDANANVASITDQQEAVFSRTLGYDDLDRLTSASAPGVWGSATYAYDPVDNLRAATVGSRSTTLAFNTNNQLSSITTNGVAASYVFDARGNLTSKGGQSFGFDLGNRMTSNAGGSYTYDGHGRRFRIAGTDGSVRMQLYSQAGQLLWATSTGGPRPTSTTAYIYLGGKAIAEANSASGTQYLHTDGLGSPVARTNNAGTLINRTRYEPYGYVAAGTKPSAAVGALGFTGHVQDPETDLVYMQQRYYDPIAGRFLSVDPIVTDANTGKGFGLYTYVDNNPYTKVDPDGRSPLDIAFLAVDAAKLVAAVNSGVGVGAAVADLAMSAVGVAAPIPGAGQALKGITGTYKLVFKSGKEYIGKGGPKRMADSIKRLGAKEGEVAKGEYKAAKNEREAYKEESRQIEAAGGAKSQNPDTNLVNKIDSPGTKMRLEDGEKVVKQ